MWDGCPLRIDWSEDLDFDFILNAFPGCIIYLNIPYSKAAHALPKIIKQYLLGRNIVLLCLEDSMQSKFAKRFVKVLGSVQNIGEVKFKGFKNKLTQQCVLVYLL